MIDPIIAGEPGAREMPIRTVWRVTDGHSYERRWWGPAGAVKALQNGKSNILSGAVAVVFDQQPGSPIAILTVSYTGQPSGTPEAAVTETMEVEFSDQTVKIHRNPSFIGIPTADIARMEELLKDRTANAESDPDMLAYYNLRLRDVESYRIKMPVVTWTRVVGAQYPSELDLQLAGYLLTTADLVDTVGAPVLWSIPTGNVGVEAGGDYIEGWFMDARAGYSGDGKIQMTIRGEFGIWENSLYELAP